MVWRTSSSLPQRRLLSRFSVKGRASTPSSSKASNQKLMPHTRDSILFFAHSLEWNSQFKLFSFQLDCASYLSILFLALSRRQGSQSFFVKWPALFRHFIYRYFFLVAYKKIQLNNALSYPFNTNTTDKWKHSKSYLGQNWHNSRNKNRQRKYTIWILVESKWNEILLLEWSPSNRMFTKLPNVWNYVPAPNLKNKPNTPY